MQIFNETILTATSEQSTAVQCSGYKAGFLVTTNFSLTVNLEVSDDGVTFITHPISYVLSGVDVVGQGVLVATEWADTLDVSPFQYCRLNFTNASGSTATVTAKVFLYLKAR